jgi:hypothetical protein
MNPVCFKRHVITVSPTRGSLPLSTHSAHSICIIAAVAGAASVHIGSMDPVCFKRHVITVSPIGGSLPLSIHTAQSLLSQSQSQSQSQSLLSIYLSHF